ncbi:hypothetical protein Trydic_g16160 [Trypoxylus dichotomus]
MSTSPDVSSIEWVQNIMRRKLRNLMNPSRRLEALEHKLKVTWDTIPQENIDHLLESMPLRTAENSAGAVFAPETDLSGGYRCSANAQALPNGPWATGTIVPISLTFLASKINRRAVIYWLAS